MDSLILRPATPADAATFALWDTRPHVMAAVSNDGRSSFGCDWTDELQPQRGLAYFVAEHDGRPVGAMSITDPAIEAGQYWGPSPPGLRALDIWIGEPDCLGRGLGTRMMGIALARCFAAPEVHAVLVDPLAGNTRAHRFYQRLGFRFVEQRFFDEADCHVYRLDRADWR